MYYNLLPFGCSALGYENAECYGEIIKKEMLGADVKREKEKTMNKKTWSSSVGCGDGESRD